MPSKGAMRGLSGGMCHSHGLAQSKLPTHAKMNVQGVLIETMVERRFRNFVEFQIFKVSIWTKHFWVIRKTAIPTENRLKKRNRAARRISVKI